jgi:hypothetical protein
MNDKLEMYKNLIFLAESLNLLHASYRDVKFNTSIVELIH